MKTFKTFLKENNLSEDLHQQLQDILDDDSQDPENKYTNFTNHAKTLIQQKINPGININKRSGSSRAVFRLKELTPITIDNEPTKSRRVLKIAYPGELDEYKTENEPLLGNMQNELEADPQIRQNFGMLTKTPDGKYQTNPNGILVPVHSHHPNYDYLEMDYAPSPEQHQFKKLTQSQDFPDGLRDYDIYRALTHEWDDAYGRSIPKNKEEHEKIMNHPLVQKLQNLVVNTGIYPHDLHYENFGIWTHPLTRQKHLVITDYGLGKTPSINVPKAYRERRIRQYES